MGRPFQGTTREIAQTSRRATRHGSYPDMFFSLLQHRGRETEIRTRVLMHPKHAGTARLPHFPTVKLAPSLRLERRPSSLTVKCPANWTRMELNSVPCHLILSSTTLCCVHLSHVLSPSFSTNPYRLPEGCYFLGKIGSPDEI